MESQFTTSCQRRPYLLRWRLASLISLPVSVVLLAGCTTHRTAGLPVPAPVSNEGPTSQQPAPRPPVGQDTVVVSGRAYSARGVPQQGVGVGFRRQACADCHPYLARTDAAGSYEISLSAGDYLAACSAGAEEDCVTTSSDDVLQLDQPTNTVDFVVESDNGPTPSTNGAPTPSTEGRLQTTAKADLSGHVTDTHGQPISGVTIELLEVGNGRPATTTDESGYYEIDVSVPATVICDVGAEIDCSARGRTDPVTVDSGQAPQVIDFVATLPPSCTRVADGPITCSG